MLVVIFGCVSDKDSDILLNKVIATAEYQYNKVNDVYKQKLVPRTQYKDGRLKSVSAFDWTSGFFGGNMWYLYELTGDSKWKEEGVRYTEILDTIQYWSGNHDIGFMINCSYGNGYRLGHNREYSKVMVNSAESLCKRYNPVTKAIKSWDYRKAWNGTEWFFPVIIDNMMNLELLFKASEITGNKKYHDIAVTHANTTMENHYRSDFSSYHVIDYDSLTGKVLDKATCQGYSDESSWARGQAWGLYGYVVCYRATKDEKYLKFAQSIADYIMNHPSIPQDKIPLWDYHVNQKDLIVEWNYDPQKNYLLRDVSAATITASALLELSQFSEQNLSTNYINYAEDIVFNIGSSDYLANDSEDNFFILKHSVGSIPHGGDVDKPVNYADYYYLEAITRLFKIQNHKNLPKLAVTN